MQVKEITEQEYNELDHNDLYYFANGCIFAESTDNLVAFVWYASNLLEPQKYYAIVGD